MSTKLWVLMDSEGNPARIFDDEDLAKHVEATLKEAEYYVKEALLINEEPAYIYSCNFDLSVSEDELETDLSDNLWVEVYEDENYTPVKITKYDATIYSLSKGELIAKAREILALYKAGQPIPTPGKPHGDKDHDPEKCKYCKEKK